MLRILKDGVLQYTNEEDVWVKFKGSENDLSEIKDEPCVFGEGVTFGDLFILINKYLNFFTNIYGKDIEELLDEIIKPLNEDDLKASKILKYLEIKWFVDEISEFLEESIQVIGWYDVDGQVPKNATIDENNNLACSFCLTPVNLLKNIPIIINNYYDVIKININSINEDNEVVDESNEDPYSQYGVCLLKTKKHFTLNNIFQSLFNELLAFGTPQEREATHKEIADNILKVNSGEIEELDNMKFIKLKEEKEESETRNDNNLLNTIDKIIEDF